MRGARLSDERGFTLPELLVVVLIIGILAAISLTVFLRQQDAGRDGSAKAGVRELVSLVEACDTDQDDYRRCDAPADLGATGLSFGAAPGDAEVTASTKDTYTARAHSRSGHWFDISRDPSGMRHDCAPAGEGGCRSDGSW